MVVVVMVVVVVVRVVLVVLGARVRRSSPVALLLGGREEVQHVVQVGRRVCDPLLWWELGSWQ